MDYMFWTVIFAVLCIIEANTSNLVTIWFAIGSLITLIPAALGATLYTQIVVFVLSSTVLLALTRPLVKKKLSANIEKTNADRVIGKTAIVKESITADKFAGTVTVQGKIWSAVSSDGSPIEEGEEVTVESIEGVKLVVKSKNKVNI
ncbi:MAG: NfeD family protein [Clostridia bacterium]|nr:NfeD family protein [Clostridia bacterium]